MEWSSGATYKNDSEQFLINENDRKAAFTRQYYEIYESRLNELRPRILTNAEKIIGKGNFQYQQLSNVVEEEEVLIIGVVVKRLSARPSILKSLLSEDKVAYDDFEDENDDEEIKRYAASSEDRLELETDKQTIRLTGALTMNDCATGCCVGLFGKLAKGAFDVKTVIWPETTIHNRANASKCESLIAVISGLELCGDICEDKKTLASFELFADWLKGDVADPSDSAKKVDRLVILGPSIASKTNGCDVQSIVRTLTLSRQEKQFSATAMTMLDKLISSLSDDIQVDLVSGVGDPCSSMWPQPPIHRVCLPRCGMTKKAVNLVTNPYQFEINNVKFLSTSGENVSDLLKTSPDWIGGDVLENIVKWQHVAPNCPDSLDGFPFGSRDPFVLTSTPNVLICGNQSKVETRRIKVDDESDEECVAFCIPKFSKTFGVGFIDLNDLSLTFKVFDHGY